MENFATRESQNNSVPACPLPNPFPKFGRGAREFKRLFPFSQLWEKGLGDEGVGILFMRDALTYKSLLVIRSVETIEEEKEATEEDSDRALR